MKIFVIGIKNECYSFCHGPKEWEVLNFITNSDPGSIYNETVFGRCLIKESVIWISDLKIFVIGITKRALFTLSWDKGDQRGVKLEILSQTATSDQFVLKLCLTKSEKLNTFFSLLIWPRQRATSKPKQTGPLIRSWTTAKMRLASQSEGDLEKKNVKNGVRMGG